MPMLKSLIMSTKHRHNYNPISEDGHDTKIPVYSEESFGYGISFHVKFIGSSEISKPNNRAEIVAVMRRIRYEFKAKSIKKRHVNLIISIDGLKAKLIKRNVDSMETDGKENLIMEYPIYRVFYVSHDSLDLKIFSFIVRDAETNVFRCYVFKEYKKNEAMHIVRTIGQAFEVCHKLSLKENERKNSSENCLMNVDDPNSIRKEEKSPVNSPQSIELIDEREEEEDPSKHQLRFMQEQIQHLQQQTAMTNDQLKYLKEQLTLETNARIDAQKKNNELLQQNQQLLNHIQQLLIYIDKPLGYSRPNDLLLVETSIISSTHQISELSHDSPDSGKGNEISSESLSDLNPFSSPHRTIEENLTSFTNFAFHSPPTIQTND